MEPSEEIRRVVDRFFVAVRAGDTDTFSRKMSEHPGVLVVGTAEEEWWHGQDAAVWEDQLKETGGFPFAWDEIEAWEEGSVGWAGANMTFAGPEETFAFRSTLVLHLEQSEWKVVQWHVSACRSNTELLGRELTVSLEQLEETIRRERPDMSETLASGPVKVRIGLHTGESRLTGEGYAGRELHRAARIAACGHGGQIVISAATRGLVDGELSELGEHRHAPVEAAQVVRVAVAEPVGVLRPLPAA